MASGQSFFQQPFRAMDFKHAHSLLYIYYAVSYAVQLSAVSDINIGVSSASKIMWKVQLWNTVMFLGSYSTWIFRCAKPRSCMWALPRARRILDARFLNFRHRFHICMVFSLTTAPMTDSLFCVWHESDKHKVLSSLSRDRSQKLTHKMFTPEGPLAFMLHQILSIFCLMQQSVNIPTPQQHPTTAEFTPLNHISNTTTFSNRDITVRFLLSLDSRSKTWGQQ